MSTPANTATKVQKLDDVERIWSSFWKEVLSDDEGNISLRRVKEELHDFYLALQDRKELYPKITGGKVDDIEAPNEVVLEHFEDYMKAAQVSAIMQVGQANGQRLPTT